jgi:transcriptional regulator with XRE-family HTH domain
MAPVTDFGRRVRRLRDALTLTQDEVARRAHIGRTHVAKIERGLLEPTVSTIVRLAKALRVKPGQFFEDAPGVGRGRKKRRKP